MTRLLATAAIAALTASVAAAPAGAKQVPWLLVFEQTSAAPGEAVAVGTAATPRRYAPWPRSFGPAIGVYLVPGRLAGHFFLRAGTPVVKLGTLQPDGEYRGRGTFELPQLRPGRYALGARVGDRFLVGDSVLVVEPAPEVPAWLGLVVVLAALTRPAARFRERARGHP
jgi:hypothetical protein